MVLVIKPLDSVLVAEGCFNFREVTEVAGQDSFLAMVVDHNLILAGVLTDGDVRRPLLIGPRLEAKASADINREPISSAEDHLANLNLDQAKYEVN